MSVNLSLAIAFIFFSFFLGFVLGKIEKRRKNSSGYLVFERSQAEGVKTYAEFSEPIEDISSKSTITLRVVSFSQD